MKIENYKRIDGWLNIRENPKDGESLYDFDRYSNGVDHTLSEAIELYNKYINIQPERSKRKDSYECEFGFCYPVSFFTSQGIKTMEPGKKYDSNLNEIRDAVL